MNRRRINPLSIILRDFVKSGAARFGNALENHPKIIAIIQWSMVLVYFSLLFIPVWTA